MDTLNLSRYALTIGAAFVMLPACGGPSRIVTAGSPMIPAAYASRTSSGTSWMLPEAKSEDLLYVSSFNADVFVYSYASHAQVGTLTGFKSPFGQCVDADGDVWIADAGAKKLVEYVHGGSERLRTLRTTARTGPIGCSVSVSGDLAASMGGRLGELLVFKNASGSPTVYRYYKCHSPQAPGYDSAGNIYFEATFYTQTSGGEYKDYGEICELPAGGSKLRLVTFKKPDHHPIPIPNDGTIMWDGKHMAVTFVSGETRIYRTEEASNGDLSIIAYAQLKDSACRYDANEEFSIFLVGTKNTPVNTDEAKVALRGNLYPNCTSDFDAWAYPGRGSQKWSIDVMARGESVSLISK